MKEYIKPCNTAIEIGNSLPLAQSGSEQPGEDSEETVEFTFTTHTNPAWEEGKEWVLE